MTKHWRPRRPRGATLEEIVEFYRSAPNERGCIEWTGPTFGNGYGAIHRFGGRSGPTFQAHRVAYELVHGPIAEGLVLRHKCDNRPCINPDHLEVGTQADNVRDKVERGRAQRGTAVKTSKLTEDDVRAIRVRLVAGETPTAIAPAFGVTMQAVWDIKAGRRWGWLS